MLDPQFREDVSALFRELHAMVAAGEKRLAKLEHAVQTLQVGEMRAPPSLHENPNDPFQET